MRTRSCAARTSTSAKNCVKRKSSSTFKKKWRLCWGVRSARRSGSRNSDGRRQRVVPGGRRPSRVCRSGPPQGVLLPPAAAPLRSISESRFGPRTQPAGAGNGDGLPARGTLRSPAAVYATLLDEGVCHCSLRTMYRLLEQEGETRERRDQLTHPPYQKPELLATAPNQLWSWDITKLKGSAKWTYFYLYVILDVFSRYVVGWMVAPRETAELAKRLIADT